MEIMESNDGAALREAGSARMREGRFAEAVEALSEAVALSPQDEAAWRLLGGAKASQGDAAGAVEAFRQAVALQPESPRNHYNLGLALQRVGKQAEARGCFEATLALDVNYAQARDRLSEIDASIAATPVLPPPTPRPVRPLEPEPLPPPEEMPAPPEPPRSSTAWGETPTGTPGARSGSSFGTAATPTGGQAQRQRPPQAPATTVQPPVQAGTILALGIVGVAGGLSCGLPLLVSPIAWSMGNQALKVLEEHPHLDPSIRNQVQAGRTLGIVGTVFLILGTIAFLLMLFASLIGG